MMHQSTTRWQQGKLSTTTNTTKKMFLLILLLVAPSMNFLRNKICPVTSILVDGLVLPSTLTMRKVSTTSSSIERKHQPTSTINNNIKCKRYCSRRRFGANPDSSVLRLGSTTANHDNDQERTPIARNTSNNVGGTLLVPRRLLSIGTTLVGSFVAYLLGSSILNRTVVMAWGMSRAGDAFGPFATLLSLIYSIVLGQIYHYYFERQQVIQDCLYKEATALQLLFHIITTTKPASATSFNSSGASTSQDATMMLSQLKAYTQDFLQTAFQTKTSWKLSQEVPQKLVQFASIYDKSPYIWTSSSSPSTTSLLVGNAIQTATSARALRISHVNSDLPVVQNITERLLSYVILLGFVLVDLNAPVLEALLFSVISGCFTTIHGFLTDLSDPFSGQWTVGTHIRNDLEELIRLM